MYVKSRYKFATVGAVILGGCGANVATPNDVMAGIMNVSGAFYWCLYVHVNGVETLFAEAAPSNPVAGQYYAVKILRDVTNNQVSLWIDGVLKISQSIALGGSVNNSTVVYGGMTFNNSAVNQTLYLGDVDAEDVDPDAGAAHTLSYQSVVQNADGSRTAIAVPLTYDSKSLVSGGNVSISDGTSVTVNVPLKV
jgi:hypothetical protein